MDEIQVLGEIVELRDNGVCGEGVEGVATITSGLSDGVLYEVPFRPIDRDLVCRIYSARPLFRLQVTGHVEMRADPKYKIFAFAAKRTIKLVEHPRFSELLNVQIKLNSRFFEHSTEDAQARASAVLCRLLADDPKLPVPHLRPAEDGGVIVQWTGTELRFDPEGSFLRKGVADCDMGVLDLARLLRGVS